MEIAAFSTEEQMKGWLNEWRQMLFRNEPQSAIDRWVAKIFDEYGPRIIGSKPCTVRRGLYRVDWSVAGSRLPLSGQTLSCDDKTTPECSK